MVALKATYPFFNCQIKSAKDDGGLNSEGEFPLEVALQMKLAKNLPIVFGLNQSRHREGGG